jgi:hypothetical protein
MTKEMKKILSVLSLASVVILISCQEDFEVGDLSFPPNVIELRPADNGQVPIGGFDVKAVIVDGPGSPLATGNITLKDAAGNTVFTEEKALTGTKDSLFVEGSTFDAESLGVGEYTLHLAITDSKGLSTVMDTKFEIVSSLYVSKETEMYIAGAFNGWTYDVMELVDNYTWEVKNIDLSGEPWKFKNRVDWSDDDWGDADCNGVMEIATGGGPDTNCGYTGLVNVRFNDETLAYTVTPAVNYAKNVNALFLLGTINNFSSPPDYAFEHTADHTWVVEEVRLKAGDAFKFAEAKTFEGKNFGDAEFDGQAEEFGANIVMPEDQADAFYKITFNDNTLAYSIELVRMPFPENLYLVGGSTAAGWDPPSSIPFKKTGDGQFEIFAYLDPAGGGFKFLEVKNWVGDWGADPNNAGKILREGESNVEIATAGFYRVTVNYNDLSYSAVETNWGIIGDATPGGWGADTDMTFVSGTTWEIDVTLGAGEYKFRANDDWPLNFGVDTGNFLRYDGGNIASPGPGDYHVEINLDPVAGYTYSITPI